MKAAIIILASLMGHALAAPASGKCKTPAPAPAPASSRETVCRQASDKVFAECVKTLQRDEPQDRCNEKRDDAKKDCLDVAFQDGTIVDGKDIRKKKAECAVPGNRAFSKCMTARFVANSDKKTSGETLEDCNKKKEKAFEACMNDKQVEPAQAEGTKASQEETTKPPQEGVTKPDQEETKPPQEATTKPPQDETTKPTQEGVTKPPQDETTKPTLEQATPNDPSEPESTG
ncbi:hypothetical protein A9K55_003426 [Cordyceps militaris]|uniref:Uncharacterized protein n=1 Tax=Cordyceps militaris TaxID=73501 RepID=A0A2H4S5G0_CORMI|nr:hypothetical protein A9K55_003426 [Cordyceps militaris]